MKVTVQEKARMLSAKKSVQREKTHGESYLVTGDKNTRQIYRTVSIVDNSPFQEQYAQSQLRDQIRPTTFLRQINSKERQTLYDLAHILL